MEKSNKRVIKRFRQELERGYTESETVCFNILQERRITWFGWRYWADIEIERVPAFAWIEQAVFGNTSWNSTLLAKVTK